LLDIPVYNNLVESLHVMFTTYLEFKNNPFLNQAGEDGGDGGAGNMMMMHGN
jgi:intraflagellar transport protein 46